MTQPHRPVGPGDHVFLVDGSSFIFRADHQSIRQDQKYNYRSDRSADRRGRLFSTKLLQFVREGAAEIMPTHLAMIFDKTENSFRRDLVPGIQEPSKGPSRRSCSSVSPHARNRPPSACIPIEQERYEADDLIATYARQAPSGAQTC